MSDTSSETGDKRIESFEEFWPFYVGEHKSPLNRALHYAGTSMAIGTVVAAAVTGSPGWLLLTPVVGYAPAWIGHYLVEGNRPATFTYPLWSLRADFKMLAMALQGRMADEVERLYPSEGKAAEHVEAEAKVDAQAGASATESTSGAATNGVAASAVN